MHAVSTNQIEDILHFNYKNIKIMGFRNFQLRKKSYEALTSLFEIVTRGF